MQGTRRVLDGGIIEIGGSRGAKHMTTRRRYQSDRLVPLVGEIVYFVDDDDLDDRVSIHVAHFVDGRASTRGWLCFAHRVVIK